MNAKLLRQEYRDFIDRWDWHQFTTNTFRNEVHPEEAHRLWCLWINMMNRSLHGPRWYKRGHGLYWCRATEFQQRGVLHYHGLLGGVGAASLDARRWTHEWFRFAGHAQLEPPHSIQAVERYVTKCLAIGGEIDFGGPLMLNEKDATTAARPR